MGAMVKLLTKKPLIVHVRNLGIHPRVAPFLKLADRYAAVSRAVANDLKKHFVAARIRVVYDGVDLEYFSLPSAGMDARGKLRARYGVPGDALVVGMAGRLTEQKGQIAFVEAAARICGKMKEAVFLHVGEVPADNPGDTYAVKLMALSAELLSKARFFWRPYESNMKEFWQLVDVAVCPSAGPEALGRTALEAMAMARPTIVSDSGGLGEIVVNGENGLICAPGNSLDLADKIERLLSDKDYRGMLGGNARRTVEQRFSVIPYSETMASLYSEVTVGVAR
jgi:glycosyltransferase involved in cell wall biosynthesis